jgi:hypothetical protein
MTYSIEEFNCMSLKQFRDLFNSLSIPNPNDIRGKYRAAFVGPAWLRTSAAPALSISGLGGWWGKEFFDDGTAINIIFHAGNFSTRFKMKFVNAKSLIDQKGGLALHYQKGGLALHYQKGNPFPWMYVVDEIRRVDEFTLLGMTIANVSGLRGMAFPFILQKQN